MSLILIETPYRTVQESPEEVSTWNAAHHPIIFRLQRQDAQITDIQDIVGTGEGLVITIDEGIEIEPGAQIYIHYIGNGEPNTVLEGLYPVIGSTAGGGETDIEIETDTEVQGTLGEGYINAIDSRSFYMIEAKIVEYQTDEDGATLGNSFARFSPSNVIGDIKADVHSWVKRLVDASNDFDYGSVNSFSKGLGQGYTVEFREYWKEAGYGEFENLLPGSPIGVLNAVKQIGDQYGQNVAEFVMYTPTGSPTQTNTFGKFLTYFDTPQLFVNTLNSPSSDYPFDISFILSENIADAPIIKLERIYDINGNLLGSSQTTLDTPGSSNIQNLGVMRMMLEGDYASTVHRVDVSLYSDTVAIGNLISETKSVFINRECDIDPILLCWLNKAGGFDYWCFRGIKVYNQEVSGSVEFENYIEDLEDAQGIKETLSDREQEKILLGSDSVSIQDIRVLMSLRSSPKVYMFTGYGDDDLPTWKIVTVENGSFVVNKSGDSLRDIAFTIIPPETYVQTQ